MFSEVEFVGEKERKEREKLHRKKCLKFFNEISKGDSKTVISHTDEGKMNEDKPNPTIQSLKIF